jgi:hypothetical protein
MHEVRLKEEYEYEPAAQAREPLELLFEYS